MDGIAATESRHHSQMIVADTLIKTFSKAYQEGTRHLTDPTMNYRLPRV